MDNEDTQRTTALAGGMQMTRRERMEQEIFRDEVSSDALVHGWARLGRGRGWLGVT